MALEITERYGKALAPDGASPTDAPGWIEDIDNPYLHGNFAPVQSEVTAESLEVVEGEIPRDLNGAYFRNGPNNRFKPNNRYHWFDGDGMVHGVWFEDGVARYRSRFVKTAGLELEAERGDTIWPGVLGPFDFSLPLQPLKDTANTDLIYFRDRLLALWYESGKPYALDPRTLATVGVEDIDGQLTAPVSAHSKVDPNTGDFVYFGYGDTPPYMRYGVVDAEGRVHQTDITLPGPRRPHDIGVTPNYTILHDFPVFFDPAVFEKTGKRVPVFHRDVPTRYGVIPRFGVDADVKWFEFEPCFMLHVVNAWEDGDWVVMLGCRTSDPTLHPDRRDGKLAAMLSGLKLQANLYEWRMNLATGETRERSVDDLNAEFPMIRPDRLGIRSRFSYHQRIPYEIPATFDGLVKYDLEDGSSTRFDYGAGIFGSEAPFAARPGSTDEDDGYVVTFVTDASTWKSAVWIFDARAIEKGPVAKVAVPGRIPAGFHATWVDHSELP
ncbi:MAG: carotenoid oxygenase family protein [Myxococcota bacterium]